MATQNPRESMLALQQAGADAGNRISVTSPAMHGTIAKVQSEYGQGVSPEIWWERVDGAKSYALIVEDPDAPSAEPFVHWVAYNIPADRTSLPEGLQEQEQLTEPASLLQGKTSKGSIGYFGPRPPVGDPPHHYHFQVFALDRTLDVPPGAGRDAVLSAMSGHVLAAGELVATYQQTEQPG
jgi:Raf kinase inhibitor-like YbhB/YbcL family protein